MTKLAPIPPVKSTAWQSNFAVRRSSVSKNHLIGQTPEKTSVAGPVM